MSRFIGDRLAAVSGNNVSIDPEQHYDSWAKKYEYDLLVEYGYCAHKIAAKSFSKYEHKKTSKIIDIGCGTGLVGEELTALGYKNIIGLDVSAKMINIAKSKKIYQNFYKKKIEDLGSSIFVPFDALISVGSFGLGHIGPESLEVLVKLVKENSLIVVFMNAEPFQSQRYMSFIEGLKLKKLIKVIDIQDHNYMLNLERPGKLLIFRKP